MNAQQLKNSILQMAVQGKLVPQDPNDEPASVLLERIRKEKEQLIKEGKIKKEKNPSYIFRGADNTPYEKRSDSDPISLEEINQFELPTNWEYVHPNDLGIFSSGKTPKPSELSTKGKYPYFKVADMNTDGNEYYLHITGSYLSNEYKGKVFTKGTIVYPKNGGAVFTNKKRILGQDSLVDLNTGTFTPFENLYPRFIYYIFSSIDFTKHYKGTALPTIDMDSVQSIVWGLPPYKEQIRIAQILDEILPLVDKYSKTENKLDNLNQSFPDQLKKSILQQAVQGKLVPQNPNDEPASVLLEKIHVEKERLINEGKIKRDKNESVIYRRDNSHYEKLNGIEYCIDDEIPFEIPDSWCWCRLNTLGITQTGNTPSKSHPEYFGDHIPFIGPGDILNGIINYHNQGLSVEGRTYGRTVPENSIIQVCIGGSIGKAAVSKQRISFNQQINAITTIITNYEYLFYVMTSPGFIRFMKDNAGGTATPIINRSIWDKMLIPLPPLKEQYRIVQTIEQLLPCCDML